MTLAFGIIEVEYILALFAAMTAQLQSFLAHGPAQASAPAALPTPPLGTSDPLFTLFQLPASLGQTAAPAAPGGATAQEQAAAGNWQGVPPDFVFGRSQQ